MTTPPAPNPIDAPKPKDLNIYTATNSQIFKKNFLAGFSRSLGGLVVYFLFIAGLGAIFYQFFLPQLQTMFQSLAPFLNTNSATNQADPQQLQQLQQLLNQIQP